MIDLHVDPETRRRNVARLKARGIRLPTLAQMRSPELAPAEIRRRLSEVGLWDVDAANLFRICWKNQPQEAGGGFGEVNRLEIPSAISGVPARIIGLVGKWFPTGAHKVGATYGCLVPRLVTGQFDPARHKAVWPSTGNFCRGGAYNSAVIGCESIAILPEEMSRERFQWLQSMAGEVITTPGGESNVKEIYDKCAELRATRPEVVIFNQFEEFGNYLWHYAVTGPAMAEALAAERRPGQRLAAVVAATGSAGTLACGDWLKQRYAGVRLAAVEALQCPTLLYNGFGGHRIEGIGDKHVPWIHNVRNTDVVTAVDDAAALQLIRLFNEPAGREYLAAIGVADEDVARLPLMGISGIANLLAAVKVAKYFELTERDVVFTVFTDSMALYGSRLAELGARQGPYRREHALRDHHRHLLAAGIEHTAELGHWEKKRIHHLKYFTWVEQQGREAAELDAQWHDFPEYWESVQRQAEEVDATIAEFNRDTGLD